MLKALNSDKTYFNNCWGARGSAIHQRSRQRDQKKKKNRSCKAVLAKSLQLIYVYIEKKMNHNGSCGSWSTKLKLVDRSSPFSTFHERS